MATAQSRSLSPTDGSASPEEIPTTVSNLIRKKPRRTRASNAKVKTGCLTCKRRHKKCDEARPSCMTCITKGYKCDGYAPLPSKKGTDTGSSSPAPRHNVEPVYYFQPRILPVFTPQEQRFFDLFCKQTVPQLAGGFVSSFWQIFIPRASYHVPCIRHAAIALAALHEDLAQGKTIAVDTQPNGSDLDFTVAQYGLAIKCLLKLVRDTGDSATEIVLSVCILFICFELLRGNHNAVLLHTQSGMNVLTDTMNKTTYTPKPRTSVVPIDAIAAVFTRIDVQASDILNAVPPVRFGKLIVPLTPSPVPSSFKDLEQSKQCLLEYQNYFMYKVREVVNSHGGDSANWPRLNRERLLRMRSENMAVLEAWHHAHQQLVHERGFEQDEQAVRASHVLLVHRHFLTVALSRFPSLDEMDFDRFTDLFGNMVTLAKKVFHSPATLPRGGKWTLSFDLGIAEPLFYVVSRCRVPHIRREALSLLRKCPHNEGIWNNCLAYCIGKQLIDLEERASPSWPNVNTERDVPRSARLLEAVAKLTKSRGDLAVGFRDFSGNHREERIEWKTPGYPRYSLGQSIANCSMRRLQRTFRARLTLKSSSWPPSRASPPRTFAVLPRPSPPVHPIPTPIDHLPLRAAANEHPLPCHHDINPALMPPLHPHTYADSGVYDGFASTASTPWNYSPPAQNADPPIFYQPFLDQPTTAPVGWAVH